MRRRCRWRQRPRRRFGELHGSTSSPAGSTTATVVAARTGSPASLTISRRLRPRVGASGDNEEQERSMPPTTTTAEASCFSFRSHSNKCIKNDRSTMTPAAGD